MSAVKAETVEEFLARGGQVQVLRKRTPKDLSNMKYQYGLFGGQTRYTASRLRMKEQGVDRPWVANGLKGAQTSSKGA